MYLGRIAERGLEDQEAKILLVETWSILWENHGSPRKSCRSKAAIVEK